MSESRATNRYIMLLRLGSDPEAVVGLLSVETIDSLSEGGLFFSFFSGFCSVSLASYSLDDDLLFTDFLA